MALVLLLLATVLGASISTPRAQAASTQIGAVEEIAAAAAPSEITAGGFAVQVGEAAGTYAVPSGYARITSWSHSAGTAAGPLTFKVYRPTGTAREWTVVASDPQTVAAGAVQSFPVDIAVEPGDRIGLSSSEDVQLAFETFNTADKIGFFSANLPTGETRQTDGTPFEEYKLDVAATLESGPGAGGGTAENGAGAGAGTGPAVTSLRIAPLAFVAARSGPSVRPATAPGAGARVTFAVSAATTVRFTVRRLRAGRSVDGRCVAKTPSNWWANDCTRALPVAGGFQRAVRAGTHRLRFTGRIGGRRLAPGRYLLVATPRSGGAAATIGRRFQIRGY